MRPESTPRSRVYHAVAELPGCLLLFGGELSTDGEAAATEISKLRVNAQLGEQIAPVTILPRVAYRHDVVQQQSRLQPASAHASPLE